MVGDLESQSAEAATPQTDLITDGLDILFWMDWSYEGGGLKLLCRVEKSNGPSITLLFIICLLSRLHFALGISLLEYVLASSATEMKKHVKNETLKVSGRRMCSARLYSWREYFSLLKGKKRRETFMFRHVFIHTLKLSKIDRTCQLAVKDRS